MKIAIDISPIEDNRMLNHRVRGTGFYIENLKKSLIKFFPENKYIFFTQDATLSQDVDIIHYPYFEPFFLTLPSKKNGKTVVTVHDLTPFVFPKHFPPGIKGSLKWLLQKRALKNADAIITDSQSSKNDIITYTGIPSTRITVVYLAASDRFKRIKNQELRIRNIRRKYNLPEKFVLYVGDVTWNKNLPRLIEATKKINIPLILVGKAIAEKDFDKTNPWNQDLGKVQRLIKENKNMLSLGFVPTEDLILLYNVASVFCMPSLYEGFGLPILEAMRCGCPVVTTREGSIPEVGGDTVFYVDAYNVDSISNGLTKVLSDKSLQRKLSENGLKQTKLFSWEKTAAQTADVYETLSRK